MLQVPSNGEVAIDEVGRGPLVGDVVTAAVMFSSPLPEINNPMWEDVKDSKKLSKKKIPIVANFIRKHALAWSIGRASVEEIDKHNILNATMIAMHRALDCINMPFQSILVDGNKFEKYHNIPHKCVVGGDATYLSIAAASILAKDTRDSEIIQLCEEYPELKKYDIHKNMGYGTKAHMIALRENGPTQFHRKSFAPCAMR